MKMTNALLTKNKHFYAENRKPNRVIFNSIKPLIEIRLKKKKQTLDHLDVSNNQFLAEKISEHYDAIVTALVRR